MCQLHRIAYWNHCADCFCGTDWYLYPRSRLCTKFMHVLIAFFVLKCLHEIPGPTSTRESKSEEKNFVLHCETVIRTLLADKWKRIVLLFILDAKGLSNSF